MTRQPGLFDDLNPPVQRPSLDLDPARAFAFYRRYVGDPAQDRRADYEEYGLTWKGHPVAEDWRLMAHALLGDTVKGRGDREQVTVLVGRLDRRLNYDLKKRGAKNRIERELAGRFLLLGHSADAMTVRCLLVGGEAMTQLARQWRMWGGEFLANPLRRRWRADMDWPDDDAGLRVLAIRAGELTYPTTTHR